MSNLIDLIKKSITALQKSMVANESLKPGPSATAKAKAKWEKDQLELQKLVDALDDHLRNHGKKAYVVVQEGGASSEVYINASSTIAESRQFISSCRRGSYRTVGPITVPPNVAVAGGDLYTIIEEVLQAAAEEF